MCAVCVCMCEFAREHVCISGEKGMEEIIVQLAKEVVFSKTAFIWGKELSTTPSNGSGLAICWMQFLHISLNSVSQNICACILWL